MRVLVMKEDSARACAIARALQGDGYAADICASSADLIAAAKQERFDLILIDLDFRLKEGFKALEWLRISHKTTPVLAVSARDSVRDRVDALDLGADDYLVKPYALLELLARIRALLRRSQGVSAPVIVYGGLKFDTLGRRVFVAGNPLQLTAREWAVLEVLLGAAGQVVSKKQIKESILGWEGELSSSAIEIYVSRLRTKLKPAGISIETVRRLGYRLERMSTSGC